MSNKPDAKEVFYGRNQPYGYLRAGNPIIKFGIIFIMLFGVIINDPSLTIQCSIVIYIMLWMPFSPKNKFQILFIHLSLGGVIMGLLHPNAVIDYNAIDIKLEIPQIASLSILKIGAVILMIIALFFVARAMTSRDYAWLIGTFPNSMNSRASGYFFSYAYASIRIPSIIQEVNTSLLSRGKYLPLSMKLNINRENSVGLWLLCIFRDLNEIASTIEYLIISKLKPGVRKTPIARKFSHTDLSILGILFSGSLS